MGNGLYRRLRRPGPPLSRAWILLRWRRRRCTPNSPRRAPLLPLLAALPQPLALLEVGASAGLCLYPDRFGYRYGNLPPLPPASGPGAAVRLEMLIWPEQDDRPSPGTARLLAVLAQDGRPVAYAGTHGQDLHWFP